MNQPTPAKPFNFTVSDLLESAGVVVLGYAVYSYLGQVATIAYTGFALVCVGFVLRRTR